MAVAFNSVLAAPTTSSTANPVNVTHIASAGGCTNGYLVAICHVRAASATLSATIGGSAATQLVAATAASNSSQYVFGRALGTVAANANIAVSITNSGAVAIRLGTLLYSGVSQSTPTSQGDSGSTNPFTTTAISAVNNGMVVGGSNIAGGAIAPTATLAAGTGASLTQRWSAFGGTGGSAEGEAAYDVVITADSNVQFTWTYSANFHAEGTVALAPAAAASVPLPGLRPRRPRAAAQGRHVQRGRFMVPDPRLWLPRLWLPGQPLAVG